MELNQDHQVMLSLAAHVYEVDGMGYDPFPGWRSRSFYVKNENDAKTVAHLVEIGYLRIETDANFVLGYIITERGLYHEDNQPDPAAVLRADIAALEAQIAVKRAALAALGGESQPAVDNDDGEDMTWNRS